MKSSYRLPILFTVASALVVCAHVALADDSMNQGAGASPQDEPSIKQYDKRLPPVLPGEEIVTESGKKMRVWSSAGPVPVMQQPTPQYPYGAGYGGWPPVIVDERNGPWRGGAAGAGPGGMAPGGVGPVGAPPGGAIEPFGHGGR